MRETTILRKINFGRLNEDFIGSYREEYEKLENKFDEEREQTCWANKYLISL